MKSSDKVEYYNFVSTIDFSVVEILNSCCNREEINVVTFEELEDDHQDPKTAKIIWLR